MSLQMMVVCDKIREADRIGDQRGVGLSPSLISKAGWFSTLIPSIFCPKNGGNLNKEVRYEEGEGGIDRLWGDGETFSSSYDPGVD